MSASYSCYKKILHLTRGPHHCYQQPGLVKCHKLTINELIPNHSHHHFLFLLPPWRLEKLHAHFLSISSHQHWPMRCDHNSAVGGCWSGVLGNPLLSWQKGKDKPYTFPITLLSLYMHICYTGAEATILWPWGKGWDTICDVVKQLKHDFWLLLLPKPSLCHWH